MLGEHAVERLCVVVPEQDGLRAGAHHAFVQRNVRLHVEVDGAAARGERLDQPDVGRIAGGAEHAILSQHERGDALLELAGNVVLVMHPHARDRIAVAPAAQCRDLALDDMRMSGEAEVVVAAYLDVAGTRGAALQGVATLPKLHLAAHVVIIDTSTDEPRLARDCGLGFLGKGGFGSDAKQHRRTPQLMRA